MVRHIGNLLAIMTVHVSSQTCLYDFVCVRAFEGEEKEGRGIYSTIFYACDGMNLPRCLCVCMHVRVCLNECR